MVWLVSLAIMCLRWFSVRLWFFHCV